MKNQTKNDPRLTARVDDEIHSLVSNAAVLSGSTISQFLIEAVTEKARQVVDDMTRIHLSIAGAEALYQAIEKPPETNDKMLEASRVFKEYIVDEVEFSGNKK